MNTPRPHLIALALCAWISLLALTGCELFAPTGSGALGQPCDDNGRCKGALVCGAKSHLCEENTLDGDFDSENDSDRDTAAEDIAEQESEQAERETEIDGNDAVESETEAEADKHEDDEDQGDRDSDSESIDSDTDSDPDIEAEREDEGDDSAEAEFSEANETETDSDGESPSCEDGPCCQGGIEVGIGGACLSGADALACTNDQCNPQGQCEHVLTAGYCLIKGTCYEDTDENPQSVCQYCDSAKSTSLWQNLDATTSCDDDNSCSYGDACDGSGACVGKAVSCPANSDCTSYSCNGTDQCIIHYAGSDTACTDDGKSCTSDYCDGYGACKHVRRNDTCLIGSLCYAKNQDDPADSCQSCQPVQSAEQFSPKTIGASCAGDGLNCTLDSCDVDSVCQHTLQGDTCLIENACYAKDQSNPLNGCQFCQPGSSTALWTQKAAGASCEDGLICTTDTCDAAGICQHVLPEISNYCYIGNKCYENGAVNPDNSCQYCSASSTTWFNKYQSSLCDDGNPCTYNDRCDMSATCLGIEITCPKNECGTFTCNGTQKCAVSNPASSGTTCTITHGTAACDEAGTCLAKSCDENWLINDAQKDRCTPLVAKVVTGPNHACAILKSGEVYCWGQNSQHQLGVMPSTICYDISSSTYRPNYCSPTPVRVNNLPDKIIDLALGGGYTCALTSGGVVYCWGRADDGLLGTVVTEKCYSLDDPTHSYPFACSTTPQAVDGLKGGVKAIAAGDFHTCAITATGAVVCWGRNISGTPNILGDGSITSGATAIAAGASHTCVLKQTNEVYCWGEAFLGNGTNNPSLTPVLVSGLPSGVSLKSLTVGYSHSCVITSAGALYCWGSNNFGQLGATTTDTCSDSPCSLAAIAVEGMNGELWVAAAGGSHTCAATQSGSVYCWGSNSRGQLGNGTTNNRSTPGAVMLSGVSVASISAQGDHTCGLSDNGIVFCWGDNQDNLLGYPTEVSPQTCSKIPAEVQW